MNRKKGTSLVFFISIFFSIAYLLLSAKPLSKEFQFSPVWKISISYPTITDPKSVNDKLLYYHLGQTIGYFTTAGDVTLFKTFPARTAISDHYYAVYDSDSQNIPFYNFKNEKCGEIKAIGYPFFIDDLIYIFLPGGSSFSKCQNNGELNWTYEGTLPISAFSANENYTAVGFADGNIKLIDNQTGHIELDYEPGGSDYPVILGLALSPDSQYIASISGQDKQRFVLTHKEGNQQKIIYHNYIDDNSPYRTIVYFTKDSRRIFYNFKNTLGIYDLKTNKNITLPLKDKIISIREDENFVYILTKNKKHYTVTIIENTNTIEGSFSFDADTAFIQAYNNNLFVGKDSSISRIEISRN